MSVVPISKLEAQSKQRGTLEFRWHRDMGLYQMLLSFQVILNDRKDAGDLGGPGSHS